MAKTTKATTIKQTLEKRYLDFLGGEGYRPRADPDTSLALDVHVKGVKCTLGNEDNSVRFQVESFLCGSKVSHALLKRSLDALRHAAAAFFEKRVPPEHLDARVRKPRTWPDPPSSVVAAPHPTTAAALPRHTCRAHPLPPKQHTPTVWNHVANRSRTR